MEVLKRWEKDFSSIYQNKSTQDFEFVDAFLQQISDEQLPHQVEDSPASTLNESITLEEVQKAVYKAKLRKARGVDDIPAEVLKNSHCINMFHKIISVAFENGIVPSYWNKGIIHPIPKSSNKDPRDPLGYRGITLIAVPSKIYCAILNQRVMNLAPQVVVNATLRVSMPKMSSNSSSSIS